MRTKGYTLIEVLIALAIVAFLAGLAVVMWRGFAASVATREEAGKLQQALVEARGVAIRDKRPTGIRILSATSFVQVQQPDDLQSIATLQRVTEVNVNGANTQLTFAGADFSDVQVGDYLVLDGGGLPTKIVAATKTDLFVNMEFSRTTYAPLPAPVPPIPGDKTIYTDNYLPGTYITGQGRWLEFRMATRIPWRITRHPRSSVGEETKTLNGVLMDSVGTDVLFASDGSSTRTTITVTGSDGPVKVIVSPSGDVTVE